MPPCAGCWPSGRTGTSTKSTPCRWGDSHCTTGTSNGHVEPTRCTPARELVRDADALLVSTPSYDGEMPGVRRNALDRLSRPARDLPGAHGAGAAVPTDPLRCPSRGPWAGRGRQRRPSAHRERRLHRSDGALGRLEAWTAGSGRRRTATTVELTAADTVVMAHGRLCSAAGDPFGAVNPCGTTGSVDDGCGRCHHPRGRQGPHLDHRKVKLSPFSDLIKWLEWPRPPI
ncbi:hypothetical protein AV521_15250 [Streptomyces sp. IMTB 2501]|uniref:NAD(P)H-dependent oxidoreductase n=1 Tax=Streptomyces sp. IMTB 2501 TaxID=1776340 RepID=UPI0009700BA8|nr:hypothetical protein AV521_15250 [Streptomyces sp. IMTB 2501]